MGIDDSGDPARLSLYHYESCAYCHRVRRVLDELGLPVELRDIRRSEEHRRALVQGGGSSQVPCLRIERDDGRVEWMYESADIADYLRERFARS